ncbi:MAG: hypothetical protein KAS94_03680 [Desulfobulbaceae bacterium]|nr:hypothetical protein [Desulfobulbaceae bacterium]
MARKTNYSFEKRQKELAKMKKKEEKRLRKQGKLEPEENEAGEAGTVENDTPPSTPADSPVE